MMTHPLNCISKLGPRSLVLAAAMALTGTSTASLASVVINEIMANNQSAVENGAGYPDYVELLNTSAQEISLAGWSLTDDPFLPRRYVFPAVSVPAGGRLLVWCSVTVSGPGLFSGFGLGAGGDRIQLLDAGGVLRDDLTFGLQAEDYPIGRVPDGTGTWQLIRPSPMAANEVQPVASTAAARINEWMARPAVGDDWLELYNPDDLPVSLSGWIVTDSLAVPPGNRPIPTLSFLAPSGHVQLFASDLRNPDADHLDFRLGAGGETLTLYASDRRTVVDRVVFGSQQDAVSQGRVPDGGDSFASFVGPEITPGAPNAAADQRVVINEVLSHTDPPLEDAIELHNPTAGPVDLSHWWLSDSLVEPRKYRIPAGMVVPAGGFRAFFNDQFGRGALGFSLNSYEGDRVVLSAGNALGELTGWQTSVRFGATRNGVSLGRVPTSRGFDFVPLAERTFGIDQPGSLAQFRQSQGRTNAAPRVGPVVLSELYFLPGLESGEAEFIELHNAATTAVPLFDPVYPTNTWRIRDGISYEFPFNVTLPAGGYLLVVDFDPADPARLAAFRSRYQVPETVPVLGPFSGRLSDTGEAVEVQWPDVPEGLDAPNPGFVPYELTERIQYAGLAPWPVAVTGSSLQRQAPNLYGNEPQHWFTGRPTPGRANIAAPADGDQDSLPDDWERANGLDPANPADALDDDDGDQASNREEYLAGTNPQDAASVFRLTAIQPTATGWSVSFLAVAGRSYVVEFRPLTSDGVWTPVARLETASSSGAQTLPVEVPADRGLVRVVTPASP